MNCISKNVKKFDDSILSSVEEKCSIILRDDIKSFIRINSGGYPIKDIINVDGEDYEVRVFLSADIDDKNYCISKPLEYFLHKTNGKIIPIGIDSGDNYYCVNNESGKVYYWIASEDKYYCISNSLDIFISLFE